MTKSLPGRPGTEGLRISVGVTNIAIVIVVVVVKRLIEVKIKLYRVLNDTT